MTDAVENQYIEMAYARVSSKNQTLARQEASILNAVPDLKAKYFYKDKWTGKEFDRPEYGRLKEKVEELTEVNPDINLRLTLPGRGGLRRWHRTPQAIEDTMTLYIFPDNSVCVP